MALLLGLTLLALACKDPGSGGGGTPTGTPGRSDLPTSMAALGDSITTGFGSCLALSSCPRNSWASGEGTLVNSHYRRIAAANPAMSGHQHNYAQAGATVTDLAGQVDLAVGAKAQYVTILIGANDACVGDIDAMTPTDEFADALGQALTALKAGLPGARVLVISIPDIYQVWQSAHTNTTAVKVWNFGVCQSLLANPTSTDPDDVARRQRFRDRISAYNSALQKGCAKYGSKCHYDGGAVFRVKFTVAQLSALDFFHPNATGQNELARVSWYL